MTDEPSSHVAVIGGGPAGYFAAIRCAELYPGRAVTIYEGTHRPLLKVLLSGGGRCNVTHNCFEPAELVAAYPRGGQELLGPFSRFQPRDTVDWFETRGVELKAESDGRIFPTTDQASTIADCLSRAAEKAGVAVRLGKRIRAVTRTGENDTVGFRIHTKDGDDISCERVLLATGSAHGGYKLAASLGHHITPLAPSLFTFKISDKRIEDLHGISVSNAALRLSVAQKQFACLGPLLITHWGLSGPAVLKLSAWAARELQNADYRALLIVDWTGGQSKEAVRESLAMYRNTNARKRVSTEGPLMLPRRLWSRLAETTGVDPECTWANLAREQSQRLAEELTAGRFEVAGKGEFKDEFVTCGGVSLKEVDFRTMESRVCPGLYFAGEILDIDGLTGGFNFQAAWTTGWIAGTHLSKR